MALDIGGDAASPFSRAFDRRVYTAAAVLAGSFLVFVGFAMFIHWPSNREAGYMPQQPIDFSHEMHAGQLQVPCLYCHSNAEVGAAATVPSVSTCMNCHLEVQTKLPDGELKPGIKTLLAHWEDKEPIAWVKVHDLADFVYFDHSRHLASDVTCQDCHGPVEKMVHMKRIDGMKMGFCIECHKQPAMRTDRNGYDYASTTAPIHCSTCHR